MRICLVNPPFLFPRYPEVAHSHRLGLRSLSSHLKVHGGHKVEFLDALLLGFERIAPYADGMVVGLPADEIVARIPADTQLVGVGAPFSQLAPLVHEIIAGIKARHPAMTVVMGGVYPSTQPRLALSSQADFIVVGEGELALTCLANGEDPRSIAGVHTRASLAGGPVRAASMIPDLDDLPMPDYDIPHIERYFDLSPRRGRGRTASLVTSRGCPHACEFCSIHPVYGHRFRARSAAAVLAEIQLLVRRFRVRNLEFEDDNLTHDRARAVDIFEGIGQLNRGGAGLTWSTPNGVEVETLDDELVGLMARSGCTELVLGLEHGDSDMLRLMRRRLRPERVIQVLEQGRRHGIPRMTLLYMVGYPGETRERFENGLRFLQRCREAGGDRVTVCPSIAQPYPGTALLKRCRAEGTVSDPAYDDFLVRRDLMSARWKVALTTSEFDEAEVLRRRDEVERAFEPRWKSELRTAICNDSAGVPCL